MGNLKLGEVATFRIQDLYGYLQTDEGLSAGTVRKVHSLLAGAFSLALNQGLISFNPMAQIKPPKYFPKPPEVYSLEEVERLLLTASHKAPAAHLRWLFALRYGMRQGEVLVEIMKLVLATVVLYIAKTYPQKPNDKITPPKSPGKPES